MPKFIGTHVVWKLLEGVEHEHRRKYDDQCQPKLCLGIMVCSLAKIKYLCHVLLLSSTGHDYCWARTGKTRKRHYSIIHRRLLVSVYYIYIYVIKKCNILIAGYSVFFTNTYINLFAIRTLYGCNRCGLRNGNNDRTTT